MTIVELHRILHPKLGAYTGSETSYLHRMPPDIYVTIEKVGLLNWSLSLIERGEEVQKKRFYTESGVCKYLYKMAVRNGLYT